MRVLSLLGFLLISSQSFCQIWINEIHYDNSGADINECIELAGIAGTDLSCYRIILYNGADGASYLTLTPSGTIDDESCGYGAVSFCVSSSQSIQNGNPDGIALYNTCTSSLTQFLSYGGTFTATNGFANGATSVDIGQTEGGGITNSSLQLVGTGNQYSDFTWQGESSTISPSFGSINIGQNFCVSTNTISTSNLSSTSFTVDCSTGSSGSIDFTSTGTFNAGNTFTVQLSDANGNFASPVDLATSLSLSGTNPSGTITFTIPAAMPSGTGYRIRIISSNPSITSADNGSNITINLTETCSPPHITSVIINSCNSACREGDNELFFGNTGDFSIEFTADNLDIYYGSSLSPTTNYTQSVHDNPSATADFNTNAGCPGLFLDAYTTTIPANASFMIANVDVCPLDVIDFTNLCGSGPIYVIYVDATSWSSGGNFANSPSCGSGGFRYFQSSITTMLNSNHTIDFYYECALNTGLDGDYAVWNENGGAAQLHGNNGCAFPPVVLPSEMISFYALRNGKQTAIFWKTASELNNDFFTISHSSDGKNFLPLGTVKGAGNLNELMNYQFTHERPSRGINYYKLSSTDYDGTTYNKGIASVLVDADGTYFDPFTAQLKFGEKSDYTVYSSDGKKLGEVWNQESMDFQQSGFIIVQNRRKGTIERLFIP
jgi:hypothetical protein